MKLKMIGGMMLVTLLAMGISDDASAQGRYRRGPRAGFFVSINTPPIVAGFGAPVMMAPPPPPPPMYRRRMYPRRAGYTNGFANGYDAGYNAAANNNGGNCNNGPAYNGNNGGNCNNGAPANCGNGGAYNSNNYNGYYQQ
ncbi:MAG: hypothetical protein V4649_08190 [Bacteroidota bacterium]